MKRLKNIFGFLFLSVVMMSFSQCASTKKLQEVSPMVIGQVSYQSWVAGVEGGGSGVNLFIPIVSNKDNVVLDSVYFQGKKVKLERKGESLYVGRFKKATNQKQDVVMSSNRIEEFKNPVPELPQKIPFELKEDECVITYIERKRTKYFKISDITKKKSQFYPSAPTKD